jgi:hypothetical protein
LFITFNVLFGFFAVSKKHGVGLLHEPLEVLQPYGTDCPVDHAVVTAQRNGQCRNNFVPEIFG